MGIIDKIKDNFTKAEFSVAPNKKVKTITNGFKKAFGISLAIYKGNMLADGDMTLAQLNKHTTKDVEFAADEFKIKGSMKVSEVEKMFNTKFGIKVQVKKGNVCVPNNITVGEAARGEY